ncbi:hypothetical protein GCM10020229_01290 [Kitasatospora albolonga]
MPECDEVMLTVRITAAERALLRRLAQSHRSDVSEVVADGLLDVLPTLHRPADAFKLLAALAPPAPCAQTVWLPAPLADLLVLAAARVAQLTGVRLGSASAILGAHRPPLALPGPPAPGGEPQRHARRPGSRPRRRRLGGTRNVRGRASWARNVRGDAGGAGNCARGNGSTCNWLTVGQLQVSRLPIRAVPRAPGVATQTARPGGTHGSVRGFVEVMP